MKSNELINPRTLNSILPSLSMFRIGHYMQRNKFPIYAMKDFQKLQNLIGYNGENRKIYRSVSLPLTDKRNCNYFSYLAKNFNNKYIKTSNKIAQSWSLSSEFSSGWLSDRPGFAAIMFETNIRYNKELIIFTPETLLNFLKEIKQTDIFNKLYDGYKQEVESMIYTLPTDYQQEVMLLTSQTKKVFVEKIHLINCIKIQ